MLAAREIAGLPALLTSQLQIFVRSWGWRGVDREWVPINCLRFDNSLEQPTELRKSLYLWSQFYYEGYKLGPKWRDSEVWNGPRYRAFVPFSCGIRARHPPSTVMYLSDRKLPCALVSNVLFLLLYVGMIESQASPYTHTLPLPGGQAVLKPNRLISWLIFLLTGPTHHESSQLIA